MTLPRRRRKGSVSCREYDYDTYDIKESINVAGYTFLSWLISYRTAFAQSVSAFLHTPELHRVSLNMDTLRSP